LFETYIDEIWPADNLAYAIALDSTFNLEKDLLIRAILDQSDSAGLVYHYLEDEPKVRGSSQALITYFLSQYDQEKAQVYNLNFLSQFRSSFWNIEFINEYENGLSASDIDSGPVLFGIGSVATIMNVKTQSSLGNDARATWAALNLAGLPINFFGTKKYLFGKELMFDIFMLWSSTTLIHNN